MSTDSEVKSLAPEWLHKTFLEEHLQNYYKNSEIEVLKFDTRLVSANEGYMSSMYRAKVNVCVSSKDKNQVGTRRSFQIYLIF